jgi:Domain of unknown function (DUF4124)
MKLRLACLACCLLLISAAHATDIYRWVDEQGHTQISDVVPDKYKGKASKLDLPPYEVSDADRADAEARAKQLKARAAEGQPSPVTAPQRSRPTRRTQRAVTVDKSDCASWRQLYAQSQECFAPFQNTNGSLKPGAFQKCTQIPDPVTTCGLPDSP